MLFYFQEQHLHPPSNPPQPPGPDAQPRRTETNNRRPCHLRPTHPLPRTGRHTAPPRQDSCLFGRTLEQAGRLPLYIHPPWRPGRNSPAPLSAGDIADDSDRSPGRPAPPLPPPGKSLRLKPSFSAGNHDDALLQLFAAKQKADPQPTRHQSFYQHNNHIQTNSAVRTEVFECFCRAVHLPEHDLVSQNKSIDASRLTKRAICRIKRSSAIVFSPSAYASQLHRSRNLLFYCSFFANNPLPFICQIIWRLAPILLCRCNGNTRMLISIS